MMKKSIPIVAIGTSAGGLQALFTFFKNVPLQIGAAFIIVRHLKRDMKSMQVDLLKSYTSLPVHEIYSGQQVEVNNIYMLPEGKKLEILDGHLILSNRPESEIINTAIDDFFISLAQDAGNNSIGIILTGLGSDGTKGAYEIEQHGGIVMVQEPSQAQFDGMPKSVIYFDHPDYVLRIEDMPHYIEQHIQDPSKARELLHRNDTK